MDRRAVTSRRVRRRRRTRRPPRPQSRRRRCHRRYPRRVLRSPRPFPRRRHRAMHRPGRWHRPGPWRRPGPWHRVRVVRPSRSADRDRRCTQDSRTSGAGRDADAQMSSRGPKQPTCLRTPAPCIALALHESQRLLAAACTCRLAPRPARLCGSRPDARARFGRDLWSAAVLYLRPQPQLVRSREAGPRRGGQRARARRQRVQAAVERAVHQPRRDARDRTGRRRRTGARPVLAVPPAAGRAAPPALPRRVRLQACDEHAGARRDAARRDPRAPDGFHAPQRHPLGRRERERGNVRQGRLASSALARG